VAKHCPNLNNVVLSVRKWDTLTLVLPSSPLPKTTQRLGLRSYKQESKRSMMRVLCNALCHATQEIPRLHVVRFMNRQTTRNLRVANRPFALHMKETMDKLLILLEASDGGLLL